MAYDIGTARGVIEIQYDGSGVDKAKQDMGDLQESSKKTGMSADDIGKHAGRAGLAIAAGLAAGVVAAANFEQRMSAIGAVSGATAGEMDALRDKALQLGKDTSFSATESAQAMEELIKAGLSVEDVLNGAADATVALAAAGEVDMATAATIASNAMNQFNLKAKDMTGVVDNIAGAANASAIDVTDFGQSLSQVGAVAKLNGVSFEDTAKAIAIMGNAGIKGSDAGTSLKSMLSRLQPTTEKQAATMERLGIITEDGTNKFYDQEGNLKSLGKVSQIMQDGLEGLSQKQKTMALQTIFGSDAIRAAAIMSDAGAKGFEKMGKAMGKVTAAEVAAERLDNFKGRLEALKGSLETAAIVIGTTLLPALTKIVDAVTKAFDWFLNLSDGTQKMIVAFAAGTAGILLMVAAFIKIMQFVQALKAALVTLRAVMALTWVAALGPIALVVAAVAAVIAIIVLLWKKSDTFRNAVIATWNAIKAAAQAVANWFMGTIVPSFVTAYNQLKTGLIAVKNFFVAVWNGIKSVVSAAINGIKDAVSKGINAIKSVWTAVWNGLKNAVSTVWNAIKAVVRTAINVLKANIQTTLNGIKATWTTIWNGIKAVASTVWNGIKTVVSTAARGLIALVTNPLNTIKTTFTNIWNQIKTAVTVAWNGIKSAVSTGINGLLNLIRALPGRIKAFFAGAGSWLIQAGKDIIQGLINGISSMISSAVAKVTELAGKVKGAISGAFKIGSPSKVMHQFGVWIVEGLANGIGATTEKVAAQFKKIHTMLEDVHNKGLKKMVANSKARLTEMSKQYQAKGEELKAAIERLNALQDEAREYRRNVSQNVQGAGDVTSFEPLQDAEGNDLPLTFDVIKQGLQAAAQKAAAFKNILAQLKAQGLNQDAIEQIIQAGPENGLAAAQAILQGGQAAIDQVNYLQDRLKQHAQDIAAMGASNMYDAGIAAAQGMVQGIESQMDKLEDAMVGIARRMIRAIRKALKIKSPSKVMMDVGMLTGLGFAEGIDKMNKTVVKTSAALGEAAATAIVADDMRKALRATASPLAVAVSRPIAIQPVGPAPTGTGPNGVVPQQPPEVRVFIGDRELTDIVRVEVGGTLAPLTRLTRQGAI